jgi:hypothetical protein
MTTRVGPVFAVWVFERRRCAITSVREERTMATHRSRHAWQRTLMSLMGSLVIAAGMAPHAWGGAWGDMRRARSAPPAASVRPHAAPAETAPIIDDPPGDQVGTPGTPIVDIIGVEGGSDGVTMTLRVLFSPDTVMHEVVGLIDLDTDQDPHTGFPPAANGFLNAAQDIGADYTLSLFGLPAGDEIVIMNNSTGEVAGTVPGVLIGQTLEITVPLSLLGNEEGNLDVGMVLGNTAQPTDAAPEAQHGTIGAPRIGGAAIGVTPKIVICINENTGQLVIIWAPDASWNCVAAGLTAEPGDKIHQILTGTME